MQKRLGFLAEVPCLKGLKDDERMLICDAMQVRNFEAGDEIIKRGDFGKDGPVPSKVFVWRLLLDCDSLAFVHASLSPRCPCMVLRGLWAQP
mmetsp:Transcript_11057/g.39038  ORF Transcript_11057/g.39038 Transcript_11057/m.39038 type:complete len:92 (+) Transcript_11057:865-1140(+)